MRVIKVLNNSLVLALNDEGQEIILMGKGIGFQKSIGYKLSPKEIDKVFVLKDRELSRRIIRLAAETDSIYFEMAKSVIDYAVENYHMKLRCRWTRRAISRSTSSTLSTTTPATARISSLLMQSAPCWISSSTPSA